MKESWNGGSRVRSRAAIASRAVKRRKNRAARAGAVLLLLLIGLGRLAGQTSWTAHSFQVIDGAAPVARLLLSGNTLFGTTQQGGVSNLFSPTGNGVVFRVNQDGSGFSVLKSFSGPDGRDVRAGLVSSGDTLYGTTAHGGNSDNGTIFKVSANGLGFQVLRHFSGSDGASPLGELALSSNTLYGTTFRGGASNQGTIFKLNTDGSGYALLKSFSGSDGRLPATGPVVSGHVLYGTAAANGTYGVVFRINTDGTSYGVLKTFNQSDGASPEGVLALVSGVLYGTTSTGGAYGGGTGFRIDVSSNNFAVIKHFSGGVDGANPYGGVVFADGKLYGTTYNSGSGGFGIVFSMDASGDNYQVIKSFAGGVDGAQPKAALVFSQGALYGTTSSDSGGCCGTGQVFGLATPTDVPGVVLGPLDQQVEAGAAVLLSARASGVGLAYRWIHNGTQAVKGGTGSALLLTNAQLADAGTYAVVVTNISGAVTSSPASLEVIPAGTTPVTTPTEAALRAALDGSAAVSFACDGTIILSNTLVITQSVVLDARKHTITLSGGNLAPVLLVGSNASLAMINLTIANGMGSFGGAMRNLAGTAAATNSTFCGNHVYGLSGYAPDCAGGAIYNDGNLMLSDCSFCDNSSIASLGSTGAGPLASGFRGGEAQGGAILNLGTLIAERSTFASNTAAGGLGGWGGSGSWCYCIPTTDLSGGRGGNGGDGSGGALCSFGTASFVNCTFALNAGTGGAGGSGGSGGQGLDDRGFPIYFAGGSGGNGGTGSSAIYDPNGLVRLTNCTLAANSAAAGVGGSGGYGFPSGVPGTNGTAAVGIKSAGAGLVNTIMANSVNCYGSLTDLGHNLSSDGTCAFTAPGSLNNRDPRLGSLADNGGTTLTLMPLAGSPAINGGDTTAAPTIDQRGLLRPVGPAADIGAVETGWPPVLQISPATGSGYDLRADGYAGVLCRLLASTNLLDWLAIGTNLIGTDGLLFFHDPDPSFAQRFYRIISP